LDKNLRQHLYGNQKITNIDGKEPWGVEPISKVFKWAFSRHLTGTILVKRGRTKMVYNVEELKRTIKNINL
jgi:hypothetical protein